MARTSDPHAASVKSWLTRARNAGSGTAVQQSGDFAGTDPQRALSGRVVGVEGLGGGISETYVVTLESGQKANFKVAVVAPEDPREEGGAESEVAAWEVAKLVGMDDMVPPAIIREIDVPGDPRPRRGYGPGVKRGSLALWQEGRPAGDYDPNESPDAHNARVFDGQEDLQRAAMFDYIIGNQDRHEGNWVVGRADGKIRLIDHNLAFTEAEGRGSVYSEFLDRIRTMTQKDSGEERLLNPLSDQSAARFAATYLAKKSQILAKLGASGLSASKVAAVASRIDRAASGLSWADLMGWNDGPSMRDQGS